MKASAKLKNLTSKSNRPVIVRNLSKIMDVRILDIDIQDSRLNFVCDTKEALHKVKNELKRIGFPVVQCKYEFYRKVRNSLNPAQNEIDVIE